MASMNALAAAAASGPSIEKGITLDSLDARILQYYYGTFKLNKLIEKTHDLLKRCEKGDTIPLTNNILLLSGPIFNINDLIYKRFEILNNGGSFNLENPIQSQLNTNSINFDLFENLTNYDTTKSQSLPNSKKSITILKLFKELSTNALKIYQERLKQALLERTASRLPGPNGQPIAFDVEKIKDLLNFPEIDSLPLLIFESTDKLQKNEDEVKMMLQDIDLLSIKTIVSSLDRALLTLQPLIKSLEKCKTKKDVVLLDKWDYAVHRSLTLLLRLADLYAVVRKFGKRIFFQDYHYLKALSHYYKLINVRLASLESCFNQLRKSNLLLASITKLTRQGARLQVRPESLLTLAKDAKNGYQMVQESTKSLKELYLLWTLSAEDFTKKHDTSTSVTSLREKAKNDVLKQRLEQSQKLIEDRKHMTQRLEKMYIDPLKNKADVESQAKFMKKIEDQAREERLISEALDRDLKELSVSPSNLSRSSSISNGSTSSSLTLHQSPTTAMSRSPSLQRNNNTTVNQKRRNSVILASSSPPATRNKATLARRNSVSSKNSDQTSNFYLTPSKIHSSNSSLRSSIASVSSMDSSISTPSPSRLLSPSSKGKVLTETPLRRSASLQHRSNAAAGAGAAFINKKVANKSNSLQSSSQAIQLTLQQQDLPKPMSPPQTKPLTAQERLQLHILSQSKNGNMSVKTLPEKPKMVYKSFAPKLTSPASSIDSGSRNNSLTRSSPLLLLPPSPSNSRSSSLQSISESPLRDIRAEASRSIEAELLTGRMNRSRSNSLQKEESALSPSNSLIRGRGRSNSASKKPSIGITKIDETRVQSTESVVDTFDDNTLTSITVTHEELDPEQQIIKKVRFTGVPKYDASEDAPSPNKALKNIRQVVFRTSSGVEVTKKKERMLSSQEGLAFRAFNHQSDSSSSWEGFGALSQKQNLVPTMRNLVQPLSGKRLSKLFKSR